MSDGRNVVLRACRLAPTPPSRGGQARMQVAREPRLPRARPEGHGRNYPPSFHLERGSIGWGRPIGAADTSPYFLYQNDRTVRSSYSPKRSKSILTEPFGHNI